MKLYLICERIMKSLISWIWKAFVSIHEYKNIFSKRDLVRRVKLTEQQKKQIDEFYVKNYGRKVPYWWHRLYQSYTGRFDHQYIPEIIYATQIEPKTNSRMETLPYEDKNMLTVIFEGIDDVHIPKTYVFCCRGKFYNGKREPITRRDAINILCEKGHEEYNAVIKMAVDSSSGRGVRMLHIINGVDVKNNEPLEEVFKKMGSDFVVQEQIIQHKDISRLHPDSINTLRVVTYCLDDEICVAPITMRIGRGRNCVDNAHAGGIFVGVDNEGNLLKEAFTERQMRFTEHPDTHVKFEGYHIPAVPEIRKTAKKLHQQIPMLRFVSWDFAVDQDGSIVLIEVNLHSQAVWLSQMAHGKAFFGNRTAQILKELKNQ